MAHLIEPNHSDRFVAILDKHYPNWGEAQNELNELPIITHWSQSKPLLINC